MTTSIARTLAGLAAVLACLLATTNLRAYTIVEFETSLGNFDVELFDSAAPITVANFLSYVTSGAYDGTIIHRSVPNFVI
jgi:peptidyl-prolyl cis-trans isomerase A (cyclophilin A)